jgi:hypothetical protein
MESTRFDKLSSYSAALHGHKYIFPVAVWLLENKFTGAVTQPEVRRGLVHAESNRIFESLERLAEIGAARELPKTSGRRYFECIPGPYWDLVQAQLGELANTS